MGGAVGEKWAKPIDRREETFGSRGTVDYLRQQLRRMTKSGVRGIEAVPLALWMEVTPSLLRWFFVRKGRERRKRKGEEVLSPSRRSRPLDGRRTPPMTQVMSKRRIVRSGSMVSI